MPNIKAAEKWVLQSEKREVRNKSAKNRLKTLYKGAVTSGQPEAAREVESAFDRAAARGVVHPNKAARKKGRLARAVQRAAAAAAAPKATKKQARSKK